MTKPYYVVLTGHKVNVGDFLIRHKVLNLLQRLRPEYDLINFPAWEEFTPERLAIVNGSKALILAGGPALQKDCYPRIYPLTQNLSDIKVPISFFGVGTKPYSYDLNPDEYVFSQSTLDFLSYMKQSGVVSSVRDFHTLKTLQKHNFNHVLMTGCPVLYDFDHMFHPPLTTFPSPKKVVFSMGVSFVTSKSMAALMKDMILDLKSRYADDDFSVTFHHSLKTNAYQKSNFTEKSLEMADWLQKNSIQYFDIAGDLEAMLALYGKTDLHIGFRLHAHLLMSSLSKPSVLFAEDGRAIGFKDVIGGSIFNAYHKMNISIFDKIIRKFNPSHDSFEACTFNDLGWNEILKPKKLFDCAAEARHRIDANYNVMQDYMRLLP